MALTDREAAEICMALGHVPRGILSKTPQKHRFECGCGYVTTYRATFQHAVEGGIHHMRLEAKKAMSNGVAPTKVKPAARAFSA